MNQFLDYLGLLNVLFFGLVVIILIVKSDIDLRKHTISWLGGQEKFGRIFNYSLFIFSVVQVLFILHVNSVVSGKLEPLVLLFSIIGGLLLCLASIFTTTKHPLRHQITTSFCSLFVSVGVVLLAFDIYSYEPLLGYAIFASSFFIPAAYLLKKKLKGAYWEIVLSLGIVLWNVFLSVPLIYW
jgi:hypothetical membrane protein